MDTAGKNPKETQLPPNTFSNLQNLQFCQTFKPSKSSNLQNLQILNILQPFRFSTFPDLKSSKNLTKKRTKKRQFHQTFLDASDKCNDRSPRMSPLFSVTSRDIPDIHQSAEPYISIPKLRFSFQNDVFRVENHFFHCKNDVFRPKRRFSRRKALLFEKSTSPRRNDRFSQIL